MLLSCLPTCLPLSCPALVLQTENIRIAYIDEIPAGKSSVSFRLNVVRAVCCSVLLAQHLGHVWVEL